MNLQLTRLNYDYWDADYVKKLSLEFALPVLSITAPSRGMDEKKVERIVQMASILGSQQITFFPPHVSDKSTTWFTRYLMKIKRDTHLSIAVANVEPKFIFFLIPEYKNATLLEIKKVTGDTALDISNIDPTTGTDIIKAQKIL